MKTLQLSLLLLLSGCAHYKANLVDISTNTTTNGLTTTRQITTSLAGTAWFSSSQSLAKFKALQTDKSQSIGGEGVNQKGSTNVVEALKYMDAILSKVSPAP